MDNKPPKSADETAVLKIDPATLVLIIAALILVPLLLTGFISQ
ncbi:hypothetical protein [Pseudanabaena sp. FACHB-2040]|nr:hypothetical protein [Pseudanabaena sp. FACHB-2040]